MKLPRPDWIPEVYESVDDVSECMRQYTDGRVPFIVYAHGTTVFGGPGGALPDGESNDILKKAVSRPPDFKVREMQDRNFTVRFAGPVSGIVLIDAYLQNAAAIQKHLASGGLLPNEVLMVPSDAPPSHYYIGLFARAKLYADSQQLEIKHRFAPNGTSTSP